MESISCKAWEVQREKPTAAAVVLLALSLFPCFSFGNPSQFSFGKSPFPIFSIYSLHEDCNPQLGGRPVTQDRPTSLDLGSFVGTFGKMESEGLLAVRFVNPAFWGPQCGEPLKTEAFRGKQTYWMERSTKF